MNWSDAFNTLLMVCYLLMLRRIGLTGKWYWTGLLLIGLFVAGGGYFVRLLPMLVLDDGPVTDSILNFLSPAVVCLLPFMLISVMKWPINRKGPSQGSLGEIRS